MPVFNHGTGTSQDDFRNSPVSSALNGSSSSAGASINLDLTKSLVYFLTLTSNVTSLTVTGASTFSNPIQVEIHFIQDATGNRTLSGVGSNIKLAGGALTLSTAATKRDIVVFRVISGNLYEISRSQNV